MRMLPKDLVEKFKFNGTYYGTTTGKYDKTGIVKNTTGTELSGVFTSAGKANITESPDKLVKSTEQTSETVDSTNQPTKGITLTDELSNDILKNN